MVQCGLTANMVAAHLAPGVKPLAFDHTTTVREVTSQIPCHHYHHLLLLRLPRVRDEITSFFCCNKHIFECMSLFKSVWVKYTFFFTIDFLSLLWNYMTDFCFVQLFFVSVANWLNYKDRSKGEDDIKACIESCKIPRFYIPELLPLLLVGMTDVSPDLAALTLTLLEGVGEIYLKFINELDSRKVHWSCATTFPPTPMYK